MEAAVEQLIYRAFAASDAGLPVAPLLAEIYSRAVALLAGGPHAGGLDGCRAVVISPRGEVLQICAYDQVEIDPALLPPEQRAEADLFSAAAEHGMPPGCLVLVRARGRKLAAVLLPSQRSASATG